MRRIVPPSSRGHGLPLAVVDGEAVLEEAELAIRLHVVAQRRAARLDRIGDHRPHRLDQR